MSEFVQSGWHSSFLLYLMNYGLTLQNSVSDLAFVVLDLAAGKNNPDRIMRLRGNVENRLLKCALDRRIHSLTIRHLCHTLAYHG